MRKFIKRMVLTLFIKVFEKELDNLEPEVEKFLADLLRPYVEGA